MIDKPTPAPRPEPDRTPRENSVIAERATVAACARDDAAAADIRALLARQH